MFWNSDSSKRQIGLDKIFNERYRIEVVSEIVMSSLVIKTVTELRWDVRVLGADQSAYHIELLSLDNVLKETNNANMRELSAFNNAFKKMYSELNMTIDRKGELLKVNNIAEVQRKWAQVKAEMEAIQTKHQNMRDIIALNDDLFSNIANITAAVKGNEFFEVFFNVFMGLDLPGSKNLKKKSLFAQEFIDWHFDVSSTPVLPVQSGVVKLNITGRPVQTFDKELLKKLYGSFPIQEVADRVPQMTENAEYKIDAASGRLLEGLINKEEIVHSEFLKAKMSYHIIADNQEPEQQNIPAIAKKEPGQQSARSSFIVE